MARPNVYLVGMAMQVLFHDEIFNALNATIVRRQQGSRVIESKHSSTRNSGRPSTIKTHLAAAPVTKSHHTLELRNNRQTRSNAPEKKQQSHWGIVGGGLKKTHV